MTASPPSRLAGHARVASPNDWFTSLPDLVIEGLMSRQVRFWPPLGSPAQFFAPKPGGLTLGPNGVAFYFFQPRRENPGYALLCSRYMNKDIQEMADQGLCVAATPDYVSALPHLVIEPGERHALLGQHCGACGTIIAGTRLACPACGNRDQIEQVRLARSGTVFAHTVVHRSYPGVKTPFVAATVALDGGGTVRGTLIDIDPLAPVPDEIRVEMVFRDTGQQDAQGRNFLSYFFVPAEPY